MDTDAETAPVLRPHQSFDFADSDLTLISSDGIRFRVHKANLAACSVTFKNMLQDGTPEENDTPALSENSAILAIIFAMCYPAEDPPLDFNTLGAEVVLASYEAAVKYQMWVAGLALRSFVEPIIHIDPFLVIRSAHMLRDSVLMTKAATASLSFDILSQSDEYRRKTGVMWPNLLEFHFRTKIQTLDGLLKFSALVTHEYAQCNNCHSQIVPSKKIAWEPLYKKLIISPVAAWPVTELVEFSETLTSVLCSYCGLGSNAPPNGWKQSIVDLKPLFTFRW